MSFLARSTVFAVCVAGLAVVANRLRRLYEHNLLPRYPKGSVFDPYPGTPAELATTPLRRYYADLRPGVRNYDLGPNGIIRVRPSPEGDDPILNPCMIAQYAIVQYEETLATGGRGSEASFRQHIDWLVSNAAPVGEGLRILYYNYDTPEERAPWGSAIAQGMAISALLRAQEHFGDDTYLNVAEDLFRLMDAPTSDGGFRFHDDRFDLWYEEDNQSGHILNGHLFALLGVQDLYRVTRNPYYAECRDRGLQTVKDNLASFDMGFMTKYRAIDDVPANNAYHRLHVDQFEVFFQITGDRFFQRMAERFREYHRGRRYRFRTFLHLVLHAVRAKLGPLSSND